MKRRKILISLALAIFSGALAGYSALRYLEERPAALVASEPMDEGAPVVIAANDLEVGSIVREEDVRLVPWPSDAVPEGYATNVSEVVGRGVITPVRINEPLLGSKLADLGSGGGFPGIITAIYLSEFADGWVHLVESNNKKAAFLRVALAETGARGSVHPIRIEDAGKVIPHADAISARALADRTPASTLARVQPVVVFSNDRFYEIK